MKKIIVYALSSILMLQPCLFAQGRGMLAPAGSRSAGIPGMHQALIGEGLSPAAARTEDAVGVFRFDQDGQCHFVHHDSKSKKIPESVLALFLDVFSETMPLVRKNDWNQFHALFGKEIRIRLTDSSRMPMYLAPHEIVVHKQLVDTSKQHFTQSRKKFLSGLFEEQLFHAAFPERHVTQASLHNFYFLCNNPPIMNAVLAELKKLKDTLNLNERIAALEHHKEIAALDNFWQWIRTTQYIKDLYSALRKTRHRRSAIFKKTIMSAHREYLLQNAPAGAKSPDLLKNASHIYFDGQSIVICYRLSTHLIKTIRICPSSTRDALSTEAACNSDEYKGIRTDIFHDTGSYLRSWHEELAVYDKDPGLSDLVNKLLSDNVHTVTSAVSELKERIRTDNNSAEALRQLFAAHYYWNKKDKGGSKAIRHMINNDLEDILTDRPSKYPPSSITKSVCIGKPHQRTIKTRKPKHISRENIQARIAWSSNGRLRKHIDMNMTGWDPSDKKISFTADLPTNKGWVHYTVQVSYDKGKTWISEKNDDTSNGLLITMPDEREENILSAYADTFNLQLENNMPKQSEDGAYVHGSFDDIAAQLKNIRAEGYSRLYLLGALELGWAGEAGPDPSVFSIWDGKTIRKDLGGSEAFARLVDAAKEEGMKITLCVISHFARANTTYDYRLPVYIADEQGTLHRRSGWDGEWDEWHDSFMNNMRDFHNIDFLAGIAKELDEMGVALRIDVGHAFDMVFPPDRNTTHKARLFGEVVTPITTSSKKHFEQIDLRGTEESNPALLHMAYQVQKNNLRSVVYAEQWHGNEVRLIKSGIIPYNPLLKVLENVKRALPVDAAAGINDTLLYLYNIYQRFGGQTMGLFNSHDEEAFASMFRNMTWPTAAFLALSAHGPLMYHISRLPEEDAGSFRDRFDQAYTECWRHWPNNRFKHKWGEEAQARQELLQQYPLLSDIGSFIRELYDLTSPETLNLRSASPPLPVATHNGRIAAFLRETNKGRQYLCMVNFPNSDNDNQRAVERKFNYTLRAWKSNTPVGNIKPEGIYELHERFNNSQGSMRKDEGTSEFFSGKELLELGFGGIVQPNASHVYELIRHTRESDKKLLLADSFVRYQRFGKKDRVEHSYAAQVFKNACIGRKPAFNDFADSFKILITWINKHEILGIAKLSVLLKEISEKDPEMRKVIETFLLRIAANEKNKFSEKEYLAAAEILHSLEIGTIALVSPEATYAGISGGVGTYTTDIAHGLSSLGFDVVVVVPLYESNRQEIFRQYHPQYNGHKCRISLPLFDDEHQSIKFNAEHQVVNFYRSKLVTEEHGEKSEIDVLYLENAAYFKTPYCGDSGDAKFRHARLLSQAALEALKQYNYYPSIIQTNEWPTWLISSMHKRWKEFSGDPHFADTTVWNFTHNPHPSHHVTIEEANERKRNYYCHVLGFDPFKHLQFLLDPEKTATPTIDLMHAMIIDGDVLGTVSRPIKNRMLTEPHIFGHHAALAAKEREGNFFAERNGFNQRDWQKRLFFSKSCMPEVHDTTHKKALSRKWLKNKHTRKLSLQRHESVNLNPDTDKKEHIIYSIMSRFNEQKGFSLLIDYKVDAQPDGNYTVFYDPHCWDEYPTVLEFFLQQEPLAQFIVTGKKEDSESSKRFQAHFERIARNPEFKGRFAYVDHFIGGLLRDNLLTGSQWFVMPSGGPIGEPCGIAQDEAHASGTPVIAHNQDGLKITVFDSVLDEKLPPNGIKFTEYSGNAILEALFDAREIFLHDRRSMHTETKRKPVKLRYKRLQYNAFNTDHRWLRLLMTYIKGYAKSKGTKLPKFNDAIQLIANLNDVSEDQAGNAVLRTGFSLPEAANILVKCIECDIPSVRNAAVSALLKIDIVAHSDAGTLDIERRLTELQKTAKREMREIVKSVLHKHKLSHARRSKPARLKKIKRRTSRRSL